jgi:hypothetical protein
VGGWPLSELLRRAKQGATVSEMRLAAASSSARLALRKSATSASAVYGLG